MVALQQLLDAVKDKYPYIEGIMMKPSDLVFEERVRMSCFNCGKYSTNWKCPGNMPKNIDYQKMVNEYDKGAFIYLKMPLTETNYNDVRNDSSITLHKAILAMEKVLWENNESLVTSFIGGSCKLCKNGCGAERCNNPYNSRSPLESIGVNVVKSAAKYGIDVSFPPKEYMLRLGLILW